MTTKRVWMGIQRGNPGPFKTGTPQSWVAGAWSTILFRSTDLWIVAAPGTSYYMIIWREPTS